MSQPITAARIPKRLRNRIQRIERTTGLTASELIRLGLEEILARYQKPESLIGAVIRMRIKRTA